MQCPECGTWTQVLETRKQSDYTRRRYQCANMHRFTTKEVVVTAKRPRQHPNSVPMTKKTALLISRLHK